MKAAISVPPPRSSPAKAPLRPRPVQRLLAPLDHLAAQSDRLQRRPQDASSFSLPAYHYLGPRNGGDPLRIGIFATIHGDEPEGALALPKFLRTLERQPDIAEGYQLFVYPVCNPSGFEDGTRHNRAGADLNREFWNNSPHPEVQFLESEICQQAFHGIITLHSDDTSHGLYAFVKGNVLSSALIQPALLEAGRFLPRNHGARIDGFDAVSSVIHDGYPGMLQSIPGQDHPPFEITLETPQLAPLHRQVDALVAALTTLLQEYRYLQAIAQNI